jgi:hypothetical protein
MGIEVKPASVADGSKINLPQLRFEAVRRIQVPTGREGKHKKIVDQLLAQVEKLSPGTALKVSLDSLPTTKPNLRAALSRATRKRGLGVTTSSDAEYLYLWKSKRHS